MKYIIGIDAGTSNVKAVLFDVDGNEILVWALASLARARASGLWMKTANLYRMRFCGVTVAPPMKSPR